MIGYNPAIEKNRIISIAKGILRCYNQFHYVYRTCGHDVCRFFDKDWKGYTDRRKVERKALSTFEFESVKADMGYKV